MSRADIDAILNPDERHYRLSPLALEFFKNSTQDQQCDTGYLQGRNETICHYIKTVGIEHKRITDYLSPLHRDHLYGFLMPYIIRALFSEAVLGKSLTEPQTALCIQHKPIFLGYLIRDYSHKAQILRDALDPKHALGKIFHAQRGHRLFQKKETSSVKKIRRMLNTLEKSSGIEMELISRESIDLTN